MRAALLEAYGSPVVPEERPDPLPGDGRSVIEVSAAPIVPLDLLCASGASYFGRQPLPYVPGVQGVGTLRSESGEATRVWFATTAGMAPGDGSLAERCVAADADIVPVCADVPDALVAAVGTSGIAAWMALTWRARLERGEKVIVLGATGVVGQVAVAVARHLGAGRVVAVARTAESAGAAALDAADEIVLTADADRAELTERLRTAVGGDADVVIDPVFGLPATAAALSLGPGGRLVNLGGAAGDAAEFSSAALRGRTIGILGYTNNAISSQQRAHALTAVLELAAAGEVAVTHETRPLTDCTDAWTAASGGGRRIVVLP